MSEKMICPACDSYTSSILRAYEEGEPCPVCGLSARAAGEVLDAERRAITEEMAEKVRRAVVDRDRAQGEARELANRLMRVTNALRDILKESDDD